MQHINQLKLEIERLNASEIEVVYSDESINEYELQYEDEQTTNLDIEKTLEQIKDLPDNAGSEVFWQWVIDDNEN